MAANKRKILEAARKHAQKGAKDKALKEFGKLLKLDPRDSKVRLEMGDTHRRWGQVEEAIEAYSVVANQFMHDGFDARAVAVFKQIQNLQPANFTYHEPLAELYQRMGLNAEAIGCLESAAEEHREAGRKQEALGLLRKMAAIDPSNTTSRIKVADLLHQEGMKDDAISEYEAVVAELELQGDTEAVGKLFERILEIEPDRIETLVLYARNLIDRGFADRAESLAKRALEADRSPEQFELLADVYRMGKREEDLVALYRELAELYRERGDEERTREILQRYVPLEELGSTEAPNGYIKEDEILSAREDSEDDLSIGDQTTLLDGDLLSDPSLLVSDAESGLGDVSSGGGAADRERGVAAGSADSNDMTCLMPDDSSGNGDSALVNAGGARVDDNQLLVEASVYLRYGKRSQAIANLESILGRDPNHRPALEKLGEAHAEGDDTEKAVEVWSRAARVAAETGEGEAAEVLRKRIAALDAEAAAALDLTVAAPPEPDVGADSDADDLIGDASDDLSLSGDLLGDAGDDLSLSDDLIGDLGDDLSMSEDLIGGENDVLSISDDLLGDEDDLLSMSDVSHGAATGATAKSDVAAVAGADPAPAGSSDEDLPELDLEEVSVKDMEIEIDIDDASFAMESPADDSDSQAELSLQDASTSEEVAASESAEGKEISFDDISLEDSDSEGGESDREAGDETSEAKTVGGAPEGDISPEKISEDLEEADFYLEQGMLDEAEEAYSRILERVPNHPLAMVRLGELAAQRGDAPASVVGETPPQGGSAPQTGAAEDEPPTGDIGADLADWDGEGFESETRGALGEDTLRDDEQDDSIDGASIDSALDDDFGLDDAEELSLEGDASARADESDDTGELPDVSSIPDGSVGFEEFEEPDEPELLETSEAPTDALAGDSDDDAEAGGGFGFDLAAELSQSFDRDPGASGSRGASGGRGDTSEDGFAAVFAEFKKGVNETINAGDHQAHYDLGIAYREMGLLNDAFAEFRLAMESPERRVGCLQLMGMCAHEMGEPEQAIGHFSDALASDDVSPETALAIKLELGKAHEAIGDIGAARRAYEEIQAADPEFGDVASRLDELAKNDDEEPAEEDTAVTEEYETFAEFFDGDDEAETEESNSAADASESADEAPVWESFDDVVAEMDGPDGAGESSAAPNAETAAEESTAPDSDAAPEAKRKKRKKKISFI